MKPDKLQHYLIVLHVVAHPMRPSRVQAQFSLWSCVLFLHEAVDMRAGTATKAKNHGRTDARVCLPSCILCGKWLKSKTMPWHVSKPYHYLRDIAYPQKYGKCNYQLSKWKITHDNASKTCTGRLSFMRSHIPSDSGNLPLFVRRCWNARTETRGVQKRTDAEVRLTSGAFFEKDSKKTMSWHASKPQDIISFETM